MEIASMKNYMNLTKRTLFMGIPVIECSFYNEVSIEDSYFTFSTVEDRNNAYAAAMELLTAEEKFDYLKSVATGNYKS